METQEMKWDPHCDIDKLPTRLQRMALYNKEHIKHNIGEEMSCNTVNAFIWEYTQEGKTFWTNVYDGWTPKNLEEVLTKFEQEHPELLEKPKPDPHSDKFTKFKEAAAPLIKFLNENYHMNCKAIVTADGAEIVENIIGFTDENYIN